MSEAIGFVGLGVMGARMARRLLLRGHELTAWARNPERAHALVGEGVTFVASPGELAQRCETIIGCLLDDEAVRRVYEADDGLLPASRAGQVFIEHATFSPGIARSLAERLAERGAAFIDAPVTGGPEGAADGSLVAMAGGEADAVDSRRGLFADYLGAVHHIGQSGSGLRLKLVNQFLVSVHIAAAVEAAALLGIESIAVEKAMPVLMGGWAASAMLERELPRAMSANFESAGAAIGGLVPVQELVARSFEAAGVQSRLLPAVRGLFQQAVESGFTGDDPARLVSLYAGDHEHPGDHE